MALDQWHSEQNLHISISAVQHFSTSKHCFSVFQLHEDEEEEEEDDEEDYEDDDDEDEVSSHYFCPSLNFCYC
ncbi:unnamed protein product [Leuciscus chuanchicus]